MHTGAQISTQGPTLLLSMKPVYVQADTTQVQALIKCHILKISKILYFRNSNLKTCFMPTKYTQF